MNALRQTKLGFASLLFLISTQAEALTGVRWTADQANRWYQQQAWIVGSNYLPASAENALEMWQAQTFDVARIDRELALAEKVGLNSMRVFLHDKAWSQDPQGFLARVDQFLTLAHAHRIRPLFVLFDSCWDPYPHPGPQPPPRPGVHNSRWVQSPGWNDLRNPQSYPRLKQYVQTVIGRFAKDPRVLAWDLWNEPDNRNGGSYNELPEKIDLVLRLLPAVFEWAREVQPTQPLTSGVWNGDDPKRHAAAEQIQLGLSDIVSFHSYDPAPVFSRLADRFSSVGRPVFCTEYMARPIHSTLETILPIGKQKHVAMFNWGFVAGRSQTYFAWDTWKTPAVSMPALWFHDLFYPDGRPFQPAEIELIHRMISQ